MNVKIETIPNHYHYALDKNILLQLYSGYDTVYTGVINNENRGTVVLYKKNGNKRTTIALAKALLEVKLGRRLTSNEEADHIDGNCSNDSIDNLQVLPFKEHRKKHIKEKILGKCPDCNTEHAPKLSRVVAAQKEEYKFPFCSRSCASAYYQRQLRIKRKFEKNLI